MKKSIKTVTVRTVPNGYELKYDGMRQREGFLYFNIESLLGGILKHVVMGDKSEQDPEECKSLLQSMMTWPDSVELRQAYATLQSDYEDAKRTAHTAQVQLAALDRKHEAALTTIRELRQDLAKSAIKVEAYHNLKRELERKAENERIKAKMKKFREEEEEQRKAQRIKVKPNDGTDEGRKLAEKQERAAKARKVKAENDEKRLAEKVKKLKGEQSTVNEKKTPDKPKKQPTKPKETPKKIEYSQEVYDALMLPLTIDKLKLSIRTLKVLKYAGGEINNIIADVVRYTKRDLLMIRGCGTTVITEWQAWLDAHGLQMGMNPKPILKEHDNH